MVLAYANALRPVAYWRRPASGSFGALMLLSLIGPWLLQNSDLTRQTGGPELEAGP